MTRLLVLALLPPILVAEVLHTYAVAVCRNFTGPRVTLGAVARDGEELLPVCSHCRMRALRLTKGGGRVCPDCDTADTTRPEVPNRHPPTDTTGGV